ncbi:carbohydrate ABC transporter permease [Streptomyces sp. NPDC048504]|uniref:carbohydrate ABC transporter permease n=1 Tax=Streptomyces sp. NPDC048504 TaxID=3365559 RepID=UPI00371DD183
MSTGQLAGASVKPAKPSGTTRVTAGRGSGRRAGRRGAMARQRSRVFYLCVAPWALGFVALTLYPLGYALWLSLTDSDGISGNASFIGLDNYKELLADPVTRETLVRTGVFVAVVVPLGIMAGLALAVLLNRPIRGRGVFRTLLYLPAVFPPVGAAMAFKMIFDRDAGAANGLLAFADINPVTWLTDPYARYVLMMLTLWGCGNAMIISLAGLQDMPKELHEAARIDGANAWQVFRSITVPLLSPVIFFQVITGVIGALQSALPLLLAANPGTAGVTTVPQGDYLYMINVFAQYLAYGRFGYASALLWVLFAVILVITAVIFKLSSGAVFYNFEPETKK